MFFSCYWLLLPLTFSKLLLVVIPILIYTVHNFLFYCLNFTVSIYVCSSLCSISKKANDTFDPTLPFLKTISYLPFTESVFEGTLGVAVPSFVIYQFSESILAKLCACVCAQSRPPLHNPMDDTVRGILQARILEWVAFPFSRGSSQPRDQIQVFRIAGEFFTSGAIREAQEYLSG